MASDKHATMNASTIPDLLAARCAASPDASAFFVLSQDKRWQAVSWAQFARKSRLLAAALKTADVGKADRVGILAPTSLNWECAQMGALMTGALVAGIDPNYPPDQLAHVLSLLDPSVLFVEDHALLQKIPPNLRERIRLIMIFSGRPQQISERSVSDILEARTSGGSGDSCPGPEPQDAAVMVFSSGTTGAPKAIVFSHAQVLIAVEAILGAFDDIEAGTVLICWLPLANLFQRVINFCAIGRGASSYMLSDPRDLMHHIASIEPHILIGVPRVFERMHSAIAERVDKLAWPMRALVRWSLRHSRACALARLSGERLGVAASILWRLADKLVVRRLRTVFGAKLRYFVSGSAAMPLWLLEWFEGIGLPVLEAYGVSENILPIAISRLSARKLGAVGKPLAPNQVSLAEDGEILVKGPAVFDGYWQAAAEANARLSSSGAWRTGDLGRMDEDGFLSLLGRKSELFKTSGGKWVSPVRVEEQLRRLPYIEQAVVLRLHSGAIGAILNVVQATLEQKIAGRPDAESFRRGELPSAWSSALRIDIEAALENLPAYQKPIGVLICFEAFSIAGGELTTNLKLRRTVVADRYAAQLTQLESAIAHAANAGQPKPIIALA